MDARDAIARTSDAGGVDIAPERRIRVGRESDMIHCRPAAVPRPPDRRTHHHVTAGIRSVQDVLATMREQELRGQEASELELPYVAPEILMGGPPTIRSDVFTMGALAYQMVTAHSPYTAPSLPELMGKMLMSQPAAPISVNASVPQPVSDAILRALAGDQAQRFESVATLDAALRGAA